ncbi:hypothetical protein BaRGS_00000398 [Batillaria attramentaria]|uniref:Amidase domain-containing protein n=1 Tax=Batillaria attramentaria TaxID=370345 RepID=A0ABD0M8K1_9CAEN
MQNNTTLPTILQEELPHLQKTRLALQPLHGKQHMRGEGGVGKEVTFLMMWMPVRRVGAHCHNYLESIQPGLSRKVFAGVIASSVIFHLTVRGYRYYRARQTVRERGDAAREACENLRKMLEEEGPVDEQREEAIVSLSMKDLQQKLRKGELTAVEVLRAYQRKALKAHAELNCLTEPIWEAEAIAVELDLLRPNQRKPLHGIPVSVKDSLFLEGYDCHAGLQALAFQAVDRDADVIQVLKSQGAVPFVRTNFPQGLMTYACSNPMYGKTVNPHNPKRGPGGSSGGEGALLGAGGSVIGIGSDIGGSIRIPTQMCGVYGLKPTVDRIATAGIDPLESGQSLVRVAVGPMARDMGGLIEVTQALLMHRMYSINPYVPPVPFNELLFEKETPMRVGYYTRLEGAQPHPTCVRAIMEAKQALEARGHTVVEFQPPRPLECACDFFMGAVFADDGESTNKYLKDDVLDDSVTTSYYYGKLPRPVRYIIGSLIQLFAYKREFTEAWQKKKLDAVIGPLMPFPALTSGTEDKVLAGYLPVTKVTEEDIEKLKDPTVYPLTGSLEKHVKKDSEGSVGLPMGVQCIALPYQEEVVLRLMQEIDSAIRGS